MSTPAALPRSSTSPSNTSSFSAASSGDLQSFDFSASTPSITSGSASDPSSESASHSASHSADSFIYSSGASAGAGSYESSEAVSDVPSNIADGQLTPPEETPHAAARRIVDEYFFASHSGIAFRGADPNDTAEGETLEEFLAWCIRGARRHEIAIMRDLIADHERKLDVLYEWKARRRDLCEDIGTLRQVRPRSSHGRYKVASEGSLTEAICRVCACEGSVWD